MPAIRCLFCRETTNDCSRETTTNDLRVAIGAKPMAITTQLAPGVRSPLQAALEQRLQTRHRGLLRRDVEWWVEVWFANSSSHGLSVVNHGFPNGQWW